MRKVFDKFGNELECGDFVCFVANPNADWRQNKELTRKQIKAFVSDKSRDFVVWDENQPKVIASRVVKCY